MLTPIFEELAEQFKGDTAIKFAKVNTDEEPDLAALFKIRGIPTVKFFKNGKEVHQIVGAVPKSTLLESINKYL